MEYIVKMVKKQHIKVIKIPLIRDENLVRVSNFPKTHTLYLELLENKNKIKQDFINKTYIPTHLNLPKSTSEQTHKQYKDDESRKEEKRDEEREQEVDIQENHSEDENKDDDENKKVDRKEYEDKYEEVKDSIKKQIGL